MRGAVQILRRVADPAVGREIQRGGRLVEDLPLDAVVREQIEWR